MRDLDLSSLGKAHVDAKTKELSLSAAKPRKADSLQDKIVGKLTKGLSRVELGTMKSRMDTLLAEWGVSPKIIAKAADYKVVARLLALARVATE